MSEVKDPAIKLFGRTIQLPEIPVPAADSGGPPPSDDCPSGDLPSSPYYSPEDNNSHGVGDEQEPDKDPSGEKLTDAKEEDGDQPLTSEGFTDPSVTSVTNENLKILSVDNEAATTKTSKTEEEQSETSNLQEKTLKKPDKILPCPRCNSMDTKFCYYNNYNVNQPRHFCKNCQRYWTAGGNMRNMPVGAGRRRNKNSTSHYRHITVSEALHSAQADLPNGIHHPTLEANDTILTFGSDTRHTPPCESMVSVLQIAEKTMQSCSRNGFDKPEEQTKPGSYGSGDNADNHLTGSSVPVANSEEVGTIHSVPPQVPCFPGAPWPYPWNSAQSNSPLPPPAFYPAGFPMPFYPLSPYWGYAVPGSWNGHWVTSPPSLPNNPAPTHGPNSPTLGKHSRDENMLKSTNSGEGEEEPQKENNPEKCLWFPKTLRIDDPREAAKSSIWETLGIRNDKADWVCGGGLFKAFRSKGDEKNHISKASLILQANPAALSRSLNFHENS